MHPRHQHHSAYPQAIPKKSRVSAMGLPTLPRTSALKIMATLVAIVLALSFTLSLHAQDTAAGGTGPENALVPNTERTVLDPGETRWYTFLYDEGVDGDNEPSDALAELEMDRPGSIDFEVWTEDDVRMWRNGEDFNPTGAGTAAFDPDSDDNRDRSRLTWVGSGAATTTWYIVVSNESDRAAAFSLSVTGPDVYFPEVGQAAVNPTSTPQTSEAAETATASATMTTTAAAQDSTTASQDMTTMAGMGPASALSPTGARTLAPGESRWYTFRYAEGADADNPSEAVVELAISRPNSIDFEVWTEENVQQWANGEDFTPTGAGTPAFAIEDGDSDNRDRRLLRWVGSGAATTTWYVIVENTSDSAASYRLTVSGPDVFFPAQNAANSSSTAPTTSTATSTATSTTTMTTTTAITDTTMGSASMNSAVAGGTGPNDALTPMGQQRVLAPNEMRWYTFDYTGGADDEDPEEVIAELRMAQPGSVDFEVWTEDDVRSWQNNEDFSPTGVGTPAFTVEDDENADNRDRTLLRWVGSGQATTTYYIVVENQQDTPAPYRLTVTGPDVGF